MWGLPSKLRAHSAWLKHKADHDAAKLLLTFLDTEIDRLNPGATAVLQENGLDPLDAAYLLANVVLGLITMEIDPAAPKGTLRGGLVNLVERMRRAGAAVTREGHRGASS